MCVCVCVCVCVYMYIYIYIHTYTHTHTYFNHPLKKNSTLEYFKIKQIWFSYFESCFLCLTPSGCSCKTVWFWFCQNRPRWFNDPTVHSVLCSTAGKTLVTLYRCKSWLFIILTFKGVKSYFLDPFFLDPHFLIIKRSSQTELLINLFNRCLNWIVEGKANKCPWSCCFMDYSNSGT